MMCTRTLKQKTIVPPIPLARQNCRDREGGNECKRESKKERAIQKNKADHAKERRARKSSGNDRVCVHPLAGESTQDSKRR